MLQLRTGARGAFAHDLKLEQSMSAAEEMADTALPRSSGLNWLFEVATMFVVAAASLSLLLYVGFGDEIGRASCRERV